MLQKMIEEAKPKSEKQKAAEATVKARTVFEQAQVTLANQTKDEVAAWDVAKTDLQRIRDIVKENEERHFALAGPAEKPYGGFGPKKPFQASGLIEDARNDLDKSLTEGRGSDQKQKSLDTLIKESETLREWLLNRAEPVIQSAETAVTKCRMNYMHKAQNIYRIITAEICKEADKGMAIVFGAFCDDAEIRRFFALTVPNWRTPEPFPIHCAGFVSTLYPNAGDLDMYSKMTTRFPYDRARAKHIHSDNTREAAAKTESAIETEWERRIKSSVVQKMTQFVKEHASYNPGNPKLSAEQIQAEESRFRNLYIDSHDKPKTEAFVDANKPKLPKQRTVFDIERELKRDQKARYLAAGLTEKGLPKSGEKIIEPEKVEVPGPKPKMVVKEKEFSQRTLAAVDAFKRNYVARSGEQPHPDEVRTFAEDFEHQYSRK